MPPVNLLDGDFEIFIIFVDNFISFLLSIFGLYLFLLVYFEVVDEFNVIDALFIHVLINFDLL